jgi:hypothetical protein
VRPEGLGKFKNSRHRVILVYGTKTKTKLNSVSELYLPSDRRLSANLVRTFAVRGFHVVSVTDPYGRILGFLHRSWELTDEIIKHTQQSINKYIYISTRLLGIWNTWPNMAAPLTLCMFIGRRAVYGLAGATKPLVKQNLTYVVSLQKKPNTMVWVRERTTPTERQPLVVEVFANFCR